MKKDLTELVFILDKSGSMSGLEKDTIGGFNSLIEKQRQEKGEAIISTVLFNHESTIIHDRVKLEDVKQLTNNDYRVSGMTAMLDCIGETINRISNIHSKMNIDQQPEKTVFVITTDGMENSSTEYDYKKIKSLIDLKKEQGWEFIFLGANINTIKEASRMGINPDNAVNYCCDEQGIDINYKSVSNAISEIRMEKCLTRSWKKEIEKDYKNRKKQ